MRGFDWVVRVKGLGGWFWGEVRFGSPTDGPAVAAHRSRGRRDVPGARTIPEVWSWVPKGFILFGFGHGVLEVRHCFAVGVVLDFHRHLFGVLGFVPGGVRKNRSRAHRILEGQGIQSPINVCEVLLWRPKLGGKAGAAG